MITRLTLERILERACSFDGFMDIEGIPSADRDAFTASPDYLVKGNKLWLKAAWLVSVDRLYELQAGQREGQAESSELREFYQALQYIGIGVEAIKAIAKLPQGKDMLAKLMSDNKDSIAKLRLHRSTHWDTK